MKFAALFLFCIMLTVSCQTVETTDAPVVEKYVLSSSMESTGVSVSDAEELLPEEDSADSNRINEVSELPEVPAPVKEEPAKKNDEVKSRELHEQDTIVVLEEEQIPDNTVKDEIIVLPERTQNDGDVSNPDVIEIIRDENVQKRTITGEKSVEERFIIFFNNNRLYCIGLFTMLLGSLFLTITVASNPVEKDIGIKTVRNKNRKEKTVTAVKQRKKEVVNADDILNPVITNEEFLRTLLKSDSDKDS